VLVNNAANYL